MFAATLVTVLGQEFLTALTSGREVSGGTRVLLFASDLVTGIWAIGPLSRRTSLSYWLRRCWVPGPTKNQHHL